MANSSKDLLPVYLAVGTDQLKAEAVIARLKKRLEADADMTMDSEAFDGNQCDASEIVTSCQMFPVMAPKRLVVVKNADKIAGAGADKLAEYLQSPNATTILLMTASKLRKNSKIYKAASAISTSAIINCEPPRARNLTDKVIQYARQNGASINNNAAIKLIELVGQDTVTLNSEVQKLSLTAEDGQITLRDVQNNVAASAEAKP